MKKRYIVIPILLIAVLILAALSMPIPVSAQGNPGAGCPSETKFHGTISGSIYFEQHGWLQFRSMTETFNDVPDGIKIARVYTGVWGGSPGKGGDFNITVNGVTSPTYHACDPCPDAPCEGYQHLRCDTLNGSDNSNPPSITGRCHDYVTGCNVHFISYNATPYIVPGSNTITVKTAGNGSCPRGGWDGRIYPIALLVVYEDDANLPEMTYWINEGAPYMENGSACDGPEDHLNISFYFNGTHISNPGKVKYWTFGFPHVANATTEPAYMKLNGNNIDKYDYMENYGSYEIFYRWDDIPPGYLNPSSNLFWYYEPSASYGGYGMYERVNVAVLMVEPNMPNLNVSSISVNCDYLFGNESNNISATVKNNGTVNASAFNVSFSIGIDSFFSKEVRVDGGLTAGANTTVCIADPTLRNAGDSVTITVTADCNGEVAKSDEMNNEMIISRAVVNNGYKGKRYTGGDDITTWKTFDLKGDLLYSLGDSYYANGSGGWTTYNASWSASDLPVPDTATIEEARLYVMYTCDKSSAGNITDYFSMNFNGNAETPDVHHSDEKMYPNSYPYGMLAYNVTADFGVGGNVANLTNLYPGGGKVSMRGMLIVVVYADAREPKRKIIVNEGFDLLYGSSSKCTNPEEATAYAPFGAMDLSAVESVTLITVAPGAGYPYYPDEGELLFNGHIWYNVWNETNANGAQIGIDERNVTLYLQSTDNEVGFQSSADYMEASNAFLVITKAAPIFDTGYPENPYPSIFGTHDGTITVDENITVNRMYTYPCSGTGGHTKYVKIWNETTGDCAEAHWDGYIGDYHNISFDGTLLLKKGVIYNYTIRTGSYPQIHHRDELEVDGGIIRCTKFTDANGKVYYNWIPAIKLY